MFFDEKTRIETQLYATGCTLNTAHILLFVADQLTVMQPDSQ